MAHGSGGARSRALVQELFLRYFTSPALARLEDSTVCKVSTGRIAMTTDSYVVTPLEFPGGDIGRIAVCGTVNDLSVKGAAPKWLTCAFIIEEGFELSRLENILRSMKAAAGEAGVEIVTGDTKVVQRGQADGLFITTAGVGEVADGDELSFDLIHEGDAIIINGPVGGHALAVMNARHGFGLKGDIKSDVAPLNALCRNMARAGGLHCVRDLTRGGLAAALNELAQSAKLDFTVSEENIPVEPAVASGCALLGLEPVYLANEGKIIAFVSPEKAEAALAAAKNSPYAKDARIIGRVGAKGGRVFLDTALGATRVLRTGETEQLPRIC